MLKMRKIKGIEKVKSVINNTGYIEKIKHKI